MFTIVVMPMHLAPISTFPFISVGILVCHQYPFLSLVLLGTENFLKDPALSLYLGDLTVLTMCPTGSHMNNWIPLSVLSLVL